MRYRIESAPTFVQEAPADDGKPGRSAFTLAAIWLQRKSEQGLEPLAVVALGHEARCQLFGDPHARSALVFRQAATAAPSPPTVPAAKRKAAK